MSRVISIIGDLLLKPQTEIKEGCWRGMGFVFLIAGAGTGIFFLFEALVPLIGYVESGASVSALLMLVGGIVLLLNRKKKLTPQTPSLPHIQDIFKNIELEKELKNNAGKLMLLAFGVGIALSQLTNIKKLSDIYKDLK